MSVSVEDGGGKFLRKLKT